MIEIIFSPTCTTWDLLIFLIPNTVDKIPQNVCINKIKSLLLFHFCCISQSPRRARWMGCRNFIQQQQIVLLTNDLLKNVSSCCAWIWFNHELCWGVLSCWVSLCGCCLRCIMSFIWEGEVAQWLLVSVNTVTLSSVWCIDLSFSSTSGFQKLFNLFSNSPLGPKITSGFHASELRILSSVVLCPTLSAWFTFSRVL